MILVTAPRSCLIIALALGIASFAAMAQTNAPAVLPHATRTPDLGRDQARTSGRTFAPVKQPTSLVLLLTSMGLAPSEAAEVASVTLINSVEQGSIDVAFKNDSNGRPTRKPEYVAIHSRSANHRTEFVVLRNADGRYTVTVAER